ncbi:MAG: hypothetical protein GY737_27815 [Desulfobacteraceae bacterium]|nr:hypothetical protein [Desulfobacteraceae bacterium]
MNKNITTRNGFKNENEGRRASLNGATTSSPLVRWDFEYVVKIYQLVLAIISRRNAVEVRESAGINLKKSSDASSPLVCWDFEYIVGIYKFVRKTLSPRNASDQANNGFFKIQTGHRKKALHH